MDEAVRRLLMLQNTNFESLIKNLINNQELYQIVEKIVLFGEQVTYNEYNPVIHQGILYGIFTRRKGRVDIHNRMYREYIANYLRSIQEIRALLRGDVVK